MNIKISPSILTADFTRLAEEIESVNTSGADMIHFDVMDGVYVPNLSFGFKIISDVKRVSRLPLDVHLMIVEPSRYIGRFIDAGADILTIHAESEKNYVKTLRDISARGIKAGIVINPETDVGMIEPALEYADMVLLMSVNPGFGGQSFIPQVFDKIAAVRKMIDTSGRDIDLEVDGGINADNAARVVGCGANVLVLGNAFFSAADRRGFISGLRKSFERID